MSTYILDPPRPGGYRYKRGRYSDPGPRGRDPEQTTEEKLESLIMRVGEKVDQYRSRHMLCFFI